MSNAEQYLIISDFKDVRKICVIYKEYTTKTRLEVLMLDK